MSAPSTLARLRALEAEMTPGPWVDGAGDIFAADDLVDGMVRDDRCEVASCYGANRHADEAGIVALRNAFPTLLAVNAGEVGATAFARGLGRGPGY